MKTALLHKSSSAEKPSLRPFLPDLVIESFSRIAPFWPLENLIAVNPLHGLEHMPFEEAIRMGEACFQQSRLPEPMEAVNRETVKWMQACLDEGQATIPMPQRKQGLYRAWRQLALYDKRLLQYRKHGKGKEAVFPETAEQAITESLQALRIREAEWGTFLTLMLTTLPGWAACIKFRTEWSRGQAGNPAPVSQMDYLAIRVMMTRLLWQEAGSLLAWHAKAQAETAKCKNALAEIEQAETAWRIPLLRRLASQCLKEPYTPDAQFVFCIDVRSEPFRRNLESTGNYQTFGFAGFFGVPIQVGDTVTGKCYDSCPVLLEPKHSVTEAPPSQQGKRQMRRGYERITFFRQVYQSIKYTFTTPFALAECLGVFSGVWMAIRTLAPEIASRVKQAILQAIRQPEEVQPSLDSIHFSEQCEYAEKILRMTGLTHHFARYVVLCGHGSETENNAYASALDCGACGGRRGASNARVIAAILNQPETRNSLRKNNIFIPSTTRFIAAEHNTTTDEVTMFGDQDAADIKQIKQDLERARERNSAERLQQMNVSSAGAHQAWLRAKDWAQVRPEWGLARNAAFIVGPRDLTARLNLEGRCFLHSYDPEQDPDGSLLTVILTAPMVVAEWINMQYLFSTLDNIAYGGGSKITKNITGKTGIMQGNASDLMTGLPLQSVYASDTKAWHEPQRLMTVVFGYRQILDQIIEAQPVLQKLFGNGWVQLACIEPNSRSLYWLARNFSWQGVCQAG